MRSIRITVVAGKRRKTEEAALNFPDVATFLSTLWGKPIELLVFLRQSGSLTTGQLAKDLGRSYSAVQCEVKTLLELGLIANDREQKLSVPWDELLIELPLSKSSRVE